MATGRNISNLSSVIDTNNNDKTIIYSPNNTLKFVTIFNLINYINTSFNKMIEKYNTYVNNKDYIVDNVKYLTSLINTYLQQIDDIFNNSFIDKIFDKITSLNNYIDVLDNAVKQIAPTTDSTVSYIQLIDHLNNTYNIDYFTNIVEQGGLLAQYQNYLLTGMSEQNSLLSTTLSCKENDIKYLSNDQTVFIKHLDNKNNDIYNEFNNNFSELSDNFTIETSSLTGILERAKESEDPVSKTYTDEVNGYYLKNTDISYNINTYVTFNDDSTLNSITLSLIDYEDEAEVGSYKIYLIKSK